MTLSDPHRTAREVIARAIKLRFETGDHALGDDLGTADSIIAALAERGIEMVERGKDG